MLPLGPCDVHSCDVHEVASDAADVHARDVHENACDEVDAADVQAPKN